jgi:hypothetical protein
VIRLEESIDIDRDAGTTFAFLSRIECYPEWLPGVIAARQTSDGPLAIGTTFTLRLAGPTGPIDAAGEITALVPGSHVALQAEAPVASVAGELTLRPSGDATTTTITVALAFELRGAYRFAEGLVARELKAGMPGVLQLVKARIGATADE